MAMRRAILGAAVLAAALACGGCSRRDGSDQAGKLRVVVSIVPQAYFAERIGGDRVAVSVLVGPGQSPHSYSPTPRQRAELEQAAVYFRIGVPFEDALAGKLSSAAPKLRVVDLREGIVLRPEPGHEHDHAHDHGEMDPHTWLSPRLAGVQAAVMCEALVEVDPDGAADYRRRLAEVQADLAALDRKLAAALAPLKGRTFYVFHPAFGYFAAEYGLKQKAVQTGGKNPGPRQLQALIDSARAEGVRVIFVQPQFSDRAARAVAAQIGGAVVPMDPLARDYIGNLEQMADKIRKALSGGQ